MYKVGFNKIETISEYIIEGDSDFVANFGVNNNPIYLSKCVFLVKGVPHDTGSVELKITMFPFLPSSIDPES